MKKLSIIGMTSFILTIMFVSALAQPITTYRIRSPVITALAKEDTNGFDTRDEQSENQNKAQSDNKKSAKDSKKVPWTTALLWFIFIAGFIEVTFLNKNSKMGNKVRSRINRNSSGGDSNAEQ